MNREIRLNRFLLFWLVLFLLLSGDTTRAQETSGYLASVHPRLAAQLGRSQDPISFLVILNEQPNLTDLQARLAEKGTSVEERRMALYALLTTFARQSQTGLWTFLDENQIEYRPFYIVNAIEVHGDASTVDMLRRRSEVNRLAANPRIALDRLEKPQQQGRTVPLPQMPYGIAYTKAPEVWAQGFRGQGIVVASQDTGVEWNHAALKETYRGWNAESKTVAHAYNWYDAWGATGRLGCDPDPQVPCDDGGHGTHTVGTMVGSVDAANQEAIIVGMAPAAQWIGCRNMAGGFGSPASYTACFEFFLAPYPQDGDPFVDGDPGLAPDIINNSWYCPPSEGCDTGSLHQVVQTMRAAGQLVVASAGNDGGTRICGTATHPISIYPEVFSVGAHDDAGAITSFSNRGPVTIDGSGRLKPQIVAPGLDIESALPGSRYGTLSGTSMASPHVAGAVALLWSAASHLIGQLDETEQILIKSATAVPAQDFTGWTVDPVGEVACTESTEAVAPNNTYGYGRLNVAAAVEMALHPAQVTVPVKDVDGGLLANTAVVLVDEYTDHAVQGMTDAEGQATFERVYPGTYQVWEGERLVTTVSIFKPQLYLPMIKQALPRHP